MWLLKQGLAERLERARGTLKYTAEDQRRFEAESERPAPAPAPAKSQLPRIAVAAGSNMQISIEGILTKKRDFFAWLFYGANTSYLDVQAALAAAEQDPAIKTVVLFIDSPGGNVDGLFDLLGSLQAFTKKVEKRVSLAASAAYGIAAVAPGKIIATNRAAMFGSIGVAATYFVDEHLVDIASTEAPKKRPDVTTEEGKAVVREELDAIHELFVEAIAKGRGTTVADVNENFGRGAVLLADEAKELGMIDAIAKPPASPARNASADAEAPRREKIMNEDELKAQHPELFNAVLERGRRAGREAGLTEGETAGVQTERKRVLAHLKLADATGAMNVARGAIESGASTTDEGVFAEYQAAAFKRSAVTTRQQETSEAAAAVTGATAPDAASGDLGDQVADLMAKRRGRKAS